MASEPQNARPDDALSGSSPSLLTVNLQVVSPSVGVNRPLMFPGIVAATTIKQLKEKIRQLLPSRPADENQRLIHRGRAIVRETDTLLDIFGLDALRTPDQQTIHLVIRETHDSHSSAQAQTSVHGPSPNAPAQAANPPRQNAHLPFGPQPPPGFTRRTHVQVPTSNPFTPQPRLPSPSPAHNADQAAAFQQHHQNMTQWLNQMQREAMARAIVNQNQRARAQMGMRGIGDTTGNAAHNGGNNSGRGSPAPGHTVYREHIGPNGRTYQVETVVRNTGPPTPNGTMSPADVQGILQGADANEATLAMTSAMQRSTSSTSLHSLQNRSLAQPGVTTPVYPMTASGRGTPDSVASRAAGTGGNVVPARHGPEVYILSSPDGPRALLFNSAAGTGAETYYTPRLRPQTSHSQLRHSHPSALGNLIYESQGQIRSRPHHHHHHHSRPHSHPPQLSQQTQLQQALNQQQTQVQQQQQQPVQQPPAQVQPQQQNPPPPANGQIQVQDQNQPPIVPMMHGNPPAAALPPLLMQLWPHIWLVFRLALFVWFFTNPTASWYRWFTITCIAFFIFMLSTGMLNGVPDHIWRPLGRYLENLIPLEPRRRAQAGDENQQNDGAGENREPNPAEMAARLVAERQGPDGWLVTQMRRLERAGLLFLASIAPGVAERHIANLEAAARADQERREAEAREAAAAREAEHNENVRNAEGGENDNDGQNDEDQTQHQPDPAGQDNNGGDLAPQNLIAVQ
ncbi:hypothetical protein B0T10DRAFT_404213 [Thelonectria olida]|uniref:Ubiquitin-like domain-containing protein n=1 Tax=Thelonectria olida TaxID=1576542 RepID=A0A9P9AMA0_9HYPO|nr:hypothetical protein B0T10DRAFT_404213 [Thelonectria olida]